MDINTKVQIEMKAEFDVVDLLLQLEERGGLPATRAAITGYMGSSRYASDEQTLTIVRAVVSFYDTSRNDGQPSFAELVRSEERGQASICF